MVDSLKKWHSTFQERCIKTGAGDDYDEKWGRYHPKERLNVDQSPLPFVLDVKRTYEYVGMNMLIQKTNITIHGSVSQAVGLIRDNAHYKSFSDQKGSNQQFL